MKLQDKLKEFQIEKKAILATNFYNLETLIAILSASSQMHVPVILQLTSSSIEYMGLDVAVRVARQGLADYGVEGWIHLDHGADIQLIHRCLDVGFDSVMIDASDKPFEENVEITSQVVELAKKYEANTEAELGYVAKLGQEQQGAFTTVEDAKAFVSQTGVDSLAIAIGSAHGFYKTAPKLDIERLAAIHDALDEILVLHGSSGIPDDMLKEAVKNGISKVNLATEIKDTFMKNLKDILQDSEEIDLRKVFPKSIDKVVDMLKAKYAIVSL